MKLEHTVLSCVLICSNPYWISYFTNHVEFINNNSIVNQNIYKAYYKEGKMYFNPYEYIGQTVLHEYGHLIFDKRVSKEEKDTIVTLFKEEMSPFIGDEKYLEKLHKKYHPSSNPLKFFCESHICPIMLIDGVGILSGKKIGSCGHEDGYSISHLATELFAEVLEAEVLNYDIPLAIYKEESPKTYSYIRDKIYEVLRP